MPLYFAYGSNMDETALRGRCPKAQAIGPARLARHRFVIMANGWASVVRDPTSDVHGVLFDLALSDIPPLDRYEDVGHGLYRKEVQPVVRKDGGPCRALIYFGTEPKLGGASPPGYVESIVAAAEAADLPTAYVAMLQGFVAGGRQALGRGMHR